MRPVLVGSVVFTLASGARASEPDRCAQALERAASLRMQRQLLIAKALYRECAETSACAAEARADCAEREVELGRAIPTIAVDGSGDHIAIDQRACTGETPVEPGVHVVSWVGADGRKHEEQVTVAEFARVRIVAVSADRTPVPARGPTSVGPYLVAGAGVALLLGAATLETFALTQDAKSTAYGLAAANADSPAGTSAYLRAGASYYDAGQTDQALAITLAIAGAVTIGAGVAWWLTTRTSTTTSKRAPLLITF